MSNKVEAFVSRYVAVHMKGNPQLLLEKFTEPTKNICYFCRGSFPELIPVKFISGIKRKLCKECIEQEKAKGSYCRIKRIYG